MTALDAPAIERLARRRAGMKMGWFIHAGVYVAVNLLLAVLSAMSGRHWAVFPAVGWGLGLVIHGVVVYVVAGGTFFESLVDHERQRLRASQEPW
ncbi:MAG: 2TM domain-containing protein [Comamonadaceae bacterium]|nr:MAG: 2TM domain-containing protein [Comamonadaceae bacterium]